MSATQTFTSVHESWIQPALPEQLTMSNIFAVIPRKHKRQKPISRGFYENSRLSRVHQLDLEDPAIKNIPRAGVLFYTFIDDEFHLCFGKDARSGDLTDFGGGRRQTENPIKCAVREGNEESRYAFSEIKPEQVQGFFCLYSSNMLIIFIPVASPNEADIRQITEINFKNKQFLSKKQVRAKCFNEVSEIVWLNEVQIDNMFSDRPTFQMFAKVRRFMYSCIQFSQSTTIMKNILRMTIKRVKDPTPIISGDFWGEERSTMNNSVIDSTQGFTKNQTVDAFENITLIREEYNSTEVKRFMRAVHTSC